MKIHHEATKARSGACGNAEAQGACSLGSAARDTIHDTVRRGSFLGSGFCRTRPREQAPWASINKPCSLLRSMKPIASSPREPLRAFVTSWFIPRPSELETIRKSESELIQGI